MSATAITRLLLALALLAGCTAGPPPPSQEPGTVTIVFKHGKFSGNPRAFEALLREFERRHPGLLVREEVLPASTDQQHQFYAVNLEGRSVSFDLLAVDVIWVQEFARAGWIADVDHLLPPVARGDSFPEAVRAATHGGRLHAIPWYMDAGLLYYRRDLLERYGFAPPRTWPDLVRIARTILDGERDPALKGFVWQGKQYEGLVCVAHEFVWGRGADLLNDETQGAEQSVAFMRRLVAEEAVSPPSVATADEEAARHLFGAGRAIFMRNWSYAWTLLQQEGSPVKGRVGLSPLPSFPGYESVSVLGGWLLAVPRRASHAREAEALIEFLTSPEIQRRMALDLGYKPARRNLYQDAALLESQPWLRDLFPVLLAARPRPVTPYYLMLSQALQPELSAALVGTKSPQAALASARRQAAMILDLEVPPSEVR